MKFDIAISLGVNCQVRYAISRILWQRSGYEEEDFFIWEGVGNRVDYGTHYFDWCNSNAEGLLKTLKNDDPENLFNIKNLSIEDEYDGSQNIIDGFNNFIYPHIFPGCKKGTLTYENIKNEDEAFSKITYLIKKTERVFASNKNILFVRHGRLTDAQLEELFDILKSKVKNFSLMYSPNEDTRGKFNFSELLDHPQIIFRPIPSDTNYPADMAPWEEAFKDIELYISKMRTREFNNDISPCEEY